MLAVIGQLLPLSLAAAMSSVPIMAVLTILLQGHRRGSALMLMIGYLVGLLIVTAVFATGLSAAPAQMKHGAQPTVGVASLVVGVALIAYGIFLARRSRRSPATDADEAQDGEAQDGEAQDGEAQDGEAQDGEVSGGKRLVRLLSDVRPMTALGVGFVLTLRPKALLLSAAVGIVVGPAALGFAGSLIALLVYVVLGGSTVGVPIVFAIARPDAARRPLEAARLWLERNTRTVSVVVVLVIGTVIVGNGLTRF